VPVVVQLWERWKAVMCCLDGEVPLEIGGWPPGKLPVQAAGDEVAVGAECFGTVIAVV